VPTARRLATQCGSCFANDGGEFRGTLDHGALHGFWVRRQVTDDPNFPYGEAMHYAGALDVRAAGHDRGIPRSCHWKTRSPYTWRSSATQTVR